MEKDKYLGIKKDGGVVVSGYGEKLTFTRGWGKYKSKAYRTITPTDDKYQIIQEMQNKGWELASITPTRL